MAKDVEMAVQIGGRPEEEVLSVSIPAPRAESSPLLLPILWIDLDGLAAWTARLL